MRKCGAEEGHLAELDRRNEDRRGAKGGADGGDRRQDGRGVVVWML